MIEYREGSLLDQEDLTHLVHQANLYCTFGSGLALAIKKKYPEAYQVDLLTTKGDLRKLGTWSTAESKGKWIVNLYSQIGISNTDRTTSYDALVKGLTALEKVLNGTECKVGIPYKLGCGLANGSWNIVEAIIADVFKTSSVQVVVCKRPGD